MAKRLYIVSVYRPELLDALLMHVGASPDVKVVVDRRQGERRACPRLTAGKLLSDRRQSSIDRELEEHGFAIVELEDAEANA